ncbi:BTB/POZ domain-containing protein at5g47800 [Phtheirospermum japonicum]|uniref:BTB/POZ domain-containing protein at5g47800 n=1 Tax=Phtheirospermum japonicum TaxID=374723 RepID=A0A830CVQ3_9LAMI|nr:BTB/POZ domain-containing protein at5g47800 [Phtheirospermum japonicum]
MKFMKLGTCLDTFYTEEAIRTVTSDVPSDLMIRINGISYLLHQYALLPKCGLLQRLVSSKEEYSSDIITLDLQDIPGGSEAFELCAKFCYGITINLSAHNFVSAFCAAKFLRMTETVENGNFIKKLEVFFSSCILEGWKDCVATLQNAEKVYEWSENLGIVRRCIESVVDKILTPPAKVTWSYTYTRPGYKKRPHQSVPKDWWTEDISFLGVDTFRCIINATTNNLQPQLIGEALHVYACRWLLDTERGGPHESSSSRADRPRILETVVSLIPAEKGSVSVRFLIRLLRIAKFLGVSTRGELVRLSGLQLDEAKPDDLAIATLSSSDGQDRTSHDVDLVETVLRSFLRQWKRQSSLRSICKVGKTIDSYLQVIAKDFDLPVRKLICMIETLPTIARPQHDDLYKAINIYLKEHPDLSKTDKKQLCGVLDFQKLSPEVRAHAVKNERLPLRTVVQILFFEREKSSEKSAPQEQVNNDMSKLKISAQEQPGTSGGPKCQIREIGGPELEKRSEIKEEVNDGIELKAQNKAQMRRLSEKAYNKGRQR